MSHAGYKYSIAMTVAHSDKVLLLFGVVHKMSVSIFFLPQAAVSSNCPILLIKDTGVLNKLLKAIRVSDMPQEQMKKKEKNSCVST